LYLGPGDPEIEGRMNPDVSGFDLDTDLLAEVEAGGPGGVRVWEPSRVAVVLGRSNSVEQEAHAAICRRDGVPILRRLGGGGTVVLGPGCVVVSLVTVVERAFVVGTYMEAAVGLLGRILSNEAGVPVQAQGTGDLCVNNRKVLGSSVFRRRRIFFYQASLLVSMDLALVSRYLPHPSREPQYRNGRSHQEFLVTLREVGCDVPLDDLIEILEREMSRNIGEIR
jgi:lipoate-protein ligase A